MVAAQTFLQSRAISQEQEARRQAGLYNARQLESQAKDVIGASQRRSEEEKRRTNLIASRALAVAAFSGGGADDPTIINLISDIKGEGAYRSAIELYEGESEAQQLRERAKQERYGIEAGERTAKTRQLATFLSGGTSMYGIYSDRNPPKPKKAPINA